MKCLIAFGLLTVLTLVVCQDEQTEVITNPRPVGVIYLIHVLRQPEIPIRDDDEAVNTIPTGNPYKSNKLLLALAPNNLEKEKDISREKRSPGYGGGGCNVCGGGGGGYPGGGGGYHGGGGYPGGSGYGGGGYPGGGGGYGSSGSWSQASASSGSFGGGGYGGKGKYGK